MADEARLGTMLVLLASGCGSEPNSPADQGSCTAEDCCLDADDDRSGRGPGCKGPDCNDFVYGVSSTTECKAWCAAHPEGAPGCACAGEGNEVECFTGTAEARGVGECIDGISQCTDGIYASCRGEVLPEYELDDGLDNDCDGQVDEI